MKLKKKIFIPMLFFIILTTLIISTGITYFLLKSPMSKTKNEIEIIIPNNSSFYDIGDILKENKLIRNERFFVFYLKLKNIDNIYAAGYYLSPDMSLDEIVKELQDGGHNTNTISITLKEGLNIREMAKIIAETTNNTYGEFIAVQTDKKYIQELVDKYWFLTDEIQNDDIYYPLEGYLFPETYYLSSKDTSVKEIIEIMLNQTDKILLKYKDKFDNYTVHEYLSLASIVEEEGKTLADRKNIAGVFYNRLDANEKLGSDVTTYYAFKLDNYVRDLTAKEINTYNPYNTRGPKMSGKIPVGPICSPGEDSILAVIEPTNNNYMFFVADKNGKVYFTKTVNEHEAIINKLQEEGLWYEW